MSYLHFERRREKEQLYFFLLTPFVYNHISPVSSAAFP